MTKNEQSEKDRKHEYLSGNDDASSPTNYQYPRPTRPIPSSPRTSDCGPPTHARLLNFLSLPDADADAETENENESASLSLSELIGSALTLPAGDELKGICEVWNRFPGRTLKLILVP